MRTKTSHLPSNEAAVIAMQAAFDARYRDGAWINDLDENSAKDLLLRVWTISIAFRDDTGHPYTEEERSILMKAELRDEAERYCQLYADNHWEDYA